MDPIAIVLAVLLAAAVGVAVWLLLERGKAGAALAEARTRADRAEGDVAAARAGLAEREGKIELLNQQKHGLAVRISTLETEAGAVARRHADELRHKEELTEGQVQAVEMREEQLREEIAATRVQMREAFGKLSSEVLSQSTTEFLKLAGERLGKEREFGAAELEKRRVAVEQMVKPIAETLAKTDAKLTQIEKERAESFGKLAEGLAGVGRVGELLREETGKLVRALREPHVRGRYGELQLKRVAELAGMSAYCDFSEQDQTRDADGAPLRPDMVVRLPSRRVVVVDAKTNIQAYLDAHGAKSEAEAEACLERFARHVAEQATALAKKKYWAQYEGSPEFVVMFIPGDQFIDAALSRQPEILERAAAQNVLLAGPATLIGLLRAVAVGYKEQRLAEAAEELRDLGMKLHARAVRVFELMDSLGGSLNSTVNRYNDLVGSVQSRLEPSLREFERAGASSGSPLPDLTEVVVRARGDGQGLLAQDQTH